MPDLKEGDYIVFVVNDPKVGSAWAKDKPHVNKYGKLIELTDSALKYYDSEKPDDSATKAVALIKEGKKGVKKSTWARMQMRAGPNFREAAENVVAFAAYQGLIRKHAVMGPESVSFAISEAIYELGLKGIVSDMMPSILGPTIVKKDGDAFSRCPTSQSQPAGLSRFGRSLK